MTTTTATRPAVQRSAATLEEIVAQIDAGTLSASPTEHAYLSGVLTGLALAPLKRPPDVAPAPAHKRSNEGTAPAART